MIDETRLLELAITNLRKVLEFNPYKSYPGINNREEFKQLIARDPAFGTLGLDDERYIIARVDGLIKKDKFNQRIPQAWIDYQGIGFEVRSCYQIGDSKRIQADYDMSLALKSYNILPVMLVFCNTSLRSPLVRLSKSWELYQGMSSFNLVESITGFNLYNFLENNSQILKAEIDNILSNF
ncbi:type I restriction endonuclease [Floridanema evergladense]|uniref:Type I restriction endonuclease n=1 Tax=Floridaenema evergladense BLCC-F167 TaxID=3153639 RepID=A0ABV4WXL9_9CYAN